MVLIAFISVCWNKHQCVQTLLYLFNQTWRTNNLLSSRSKAEIIRIQKSSENPILLDNCRLISVSSVPCKVFERIVNRSLLYEPEIKNPVILYQYSFGQHHSSKDCILHYQHLVTDAFQKKLHLLAIFLDLNKAFDITCEHPLLTTLHEWSVRGNVSLFSQNSSPHQLSCSHWSFSLKWQHILRRRSTGLCLEPNSL